LAGQPAKVAGFESVRRWIAPHALQLAGGLACVVVVVAIDAALPLIFGDFLIDDILIAGQNPALLTWLAVGGILLFTVKGLFRYGQVYLLSHVGQRIVYELRARMYNRILDMPLREHAKRESASLVSRMTSDVGVIQNAVSVGIADLAHHFLSLLAAVAMLFVINWRLAAVSLVTLPVVSLAIKGYGGRIHLFTTRLQERIAGLTATMQESLEGIRVVKVFLMEKERRKRFAADNEKSFNASMKSAQALATINPVVELVFVMGMMVVVWFGGREVLSGQMTTGGLVAFLAYLGMASRPIGYLAQAVNLIGQSSAAARRIAEVLELPVEANEASGVKFPARIQGRVTFENVTFAYQPGREVLRGVSFTAEPGETVAIVGRSGAGKTTLVNLVARFYKPTSGTVRIDGYDLAEVDVASLRRHIGFVPQETLLFGMTIAENIAAGRDWIDRDAVVRAARLANADEFIRRLPNGYDTVVGERGANLSGGQRQRIAIARAVAGDPRILILDEATSALDAESEANVRDAIIRVRENRTTFVIAHRLSTVQGASKIVVLDDGVVAEIGSHDELLRSGVVYPVLYRKQFGEEFEETAPAARERRAYGE